MTGSRVRVRDFDPTADITSAESLLETELAGRLQARRGELMDPLEGAGLVAEIDGRSVGLVTWVVAGPFSGPREAEIRVLVVAEAARRSGVGSALLVAAERALAGSGVRLAWLVTTNDNLDALRFYRRRGWRLAELHAGAVDEARRTLKPSIPRTGAGGVPIRDELILVNELAADGRPGLPTSADGHLG